MLFVARLRRPLMVAGCVASAAAFSLDGPARSRCLKLEMSDCAARSLSASLQAVLAKPPLVEHWEAKQGEHAFLEDVLGERALDWVRGSNAQALERLGDPTGSPLFERIFAILTSKEKIPFLRKIGDQYYNFWTDEANPRGVWRRTSLESYRSGAPEWETVLDVDALNRAEGESWVYKGHTLYHPPDGTAPTRTLLQLSRGGADATVVREFDLRAKAFVGAAEGGFELPEAKSRVAWQSADTLLIGTDFGDGASLTDSGYPRTVREWARGTPLAESRETFAGEAGDVSVSGFVSRHRGVEFEWTVRATSFYTSEKRLRRRHADGSAGAWRVVAVPDDATVSQFGDQLLVSLRSAWRGHAAGSLLAAAADTLAPAAPSDAAAAPPELNVIFTPTDRVALARGGMAVTRNKLVLSLLDNVRSRLVSLSPMAGGGWAVDEGGEGASLSGVSLSAVDSDEGDDVWVTTWGYTTPTSYGLSTVSRGVGAPLSEAMTPLRALPSMFDASGLQVTQGSATSADGTAVPYFLVRRADAEGPTPTLLYGYGGFQISMTPKYLATMGAGWLERGGAYVEANIRGGGEFGPGWHQAAKRDLRNKAYEDFEAVAEDLVATGVTTPAQLACRGGSNGGLLVGNAMVRQPELWGAVVCAVPLLDMRRFNKLLAGASWMAEYGNPDTDDWDDFMWRYSAYHHIDPKARYPPMLMTTSTRDDRVHPYHARAFVKRLVESGHADGTTYYENIEGGHGGAADPKQQAFMTCLFLEFLSQTIGKGALVDAVASRQSGGGE